MKEEGAKLSTMLLNLLLKLFLLGANNIVNHLPFLHQHKSRHRLHLKILRYILLFTPPHPEKKHFLNKKKQNHSWKSKERERDRGVLRIIRRRRF